MSEEEPFKPSRRMSLEGNMADRRQYNTNSSITSDEEGGNRVIRRKSAISLDERVNFISDNEFSDSDENMELGENADEVDLGTDSESQEGSKNSKGSSGSDVRKLTKGLDWKSEEHILESLSDEDQHAYTVNDTYSFRDVNKHLIKSNKSDESDEIVKENNVNKRKWKIGSSSCTSTGKTGKLTKTLRATCILVVFALLGLTGYLIFGEHKDPLSAVVAAIQKFEEDFAHNNKSLEPRVLNYNGNYYYVHP